MVKAELIKEVKTKKEVFYETAFDPSILKIDELIDKFSKTGANEIKFIESEELSKIDDLLNRLEIEVKGSKANILVKDLL